MISTLSKPTPSVRLRTALTLTRAYSLPYVMTLGAGGVFVAGGAEPSAAAISTAVVLPVFLWIFGVLSNDFLHRKTDRIHRPERNLPEPLLRALLPLVGGVGFVLLAWAGPLSLALGIATCASGVVYGACKSWIFAANLLRGSAAGLLILTTASLRGLTAEAFLLASAFMLIDAVGNLLGDLRDVERDRAAGVRTLATFSLRAARGASCAMLVAAAALLHLLGLPWLAAATGLALGVLIILVGERRAHLSFLLLKQGLAVSTLTLFQPALWIPATLLLLGGLAAGSYLAVHPYLLPGASRA